MRVTEKSERGKMGGDFVSRDPSDSNHKQTQWVSDDERSEIAKI